MVSMSVRHVAHYIALQDTLHTSHSSSGQIPSDHNVRDRYLYTFCIHNINSYEIVPGTAIT